MAPHQCLVACAVVCAAGVHITARATAAHSLTSMPEADIMRSPRPRHRHVPFIKRVVKAVLARSGPHGQTERAARVVERILANLSGASNVGEAVCGDTVVVQGKYVGGGNFGAVYEDAKDPTRAIKVLLAAKEGPPAILENLNNECDIMKQLQGRLRVPQCYAVCDYEGEKGKTTALVMEFLRGAKPLADVRDRAKFDKAKYDWSKIGRQLYTSMMAMMDAGIVNPDQRANNILIDKASDVVFIDMGLAATKSTWDAYHAASKKANIPDFVKSTSAETWVGQGALTVNAILSATLQNCPVKGEPGFDGPCSASRSAMASALADAFCDGTAWVPYRFANKDKTSWCTFAVVHRKRDGKEWTVNSCDEAEPCASDADQCPYLVWDALSKVIKQDRGALTKATDCVGSGTSRFGDDVDAVKRLPHKFRGVDIVK